jgi:cytoskeletal protein RodZ
MFYFSVMQTIGQKLKQAREAKRITLEKAFEGTRIRIPYLQALEADDLSAMPSPVQARGYLRNYAEFLGLNFDQLLDEMRAQASSDEMITPMDSFPSPATQTPEAEPPQESTPLSKPKTARRKKTDSQPATDPTPSKPRRARKKVEPEPEAVLESQPETVEEPVAEIQPEPIIESQPEEHPQQDVGENLWQSWLNRIGSVISIRVKREEGSLPESDAPQVESESVQPATLQPLNLRPSDEIFKEVGAELRKRREMLSLNLDEVERNTRIKSHYLEALESGAMDDLPSTVQTRGMLSNYAAFLDLDVDEVLLRFADALQARHREKNPQKPARQAPNIPPIRSFIAGDMVFGIGIVVLLVGFSIWGVSRVMTIQNGQDVLPTAPSISDVLLATSDPSLITPTATLEFVESNLNEPTVTVVIPTQNLNVSVQINLIAVERTYMRVIVDGEEVFNGRVVPGNAYPFEAEEQVEVLVGSGAAIRIVYNGRDLGLLGGIGQVVSNIYSEDEIVTPTALPSQIPTNTLTPTATVPATQTPVPSSIPRTTLTP